MGTCTYVGSHLKQFDLAFNFLDLHKVSFAVQGTQFTLPISHFLLLKLHLPINKVWGDFSL